MQKTLENSIYVPSKHPFKAFVVVSFIVAVGIVGTLAVGKFFLIFANIFWIMYTAVISYVQFKFHRKYPRKRAIEKFLDPQLRFFVFVFLAAMGVFAALLDKFWIGFVVLAVWWLFSLNFLLYFKEFKRKKSI
ncbi:hypothetical protein ACFL0V_02965 [Nanoarchaeota archaeon]